MWFTGSIDVGTRGAALWPGFHVVIDDYSYLGGAQPGSRPLGLLQDGARAVMHATCYYRMECFC